MNTIQAILIAIIEGITEFLPISSTGHMIIANSLMGIEEDEFVKLYIIVIQLGAILSVVVLYWKRFLGLGNFRQTLNFYLKLVVAFLPAAVFGMLLSSWIDMLLGNVAVVGIMLLLGGIFLLFVDRIFIHNESLPVQELTYFSALKIGCFQVISMIPGVSRAAATIVGGLTQKLNRKQAAEFSFFLAVPTMLGATAKDLWEKQELLNTANISTLLLGCAVAFVVAMIAIKMFIGFLTKHGFKLFGYYRIVLGGIILLLVALDKGMEMIG